MSDGRLGWCFGLGWDSSGYFGGILMGGILSEFGWTEAWNI